MSGKYQSGKGSGYHGTEEYGLLRRMNGFSISFVAKSCCDHDGWSFMS